MYAPVQVGVLKREHVRNLLRNRNQNQRALSIDTVSSQPMYIPDVVLRPASRARAAVAEHHVLSRYRQYGTAHYDRTLRCRAGKVC